jgi:putative PEP-CTERM system TPR-repeat lipoprotein
LSISKSQAGELSRAEDELALAIRLDKDGQFAGEIDQAETVLILSHIRNRSLEKAVDLARAFIARRPEQATPYSLLSIAYAERGESAKALDAMQKARDKDPDAAEMMGNYAALQARLGDIKGATDTLKTSVSKHERHYPTLLQLASLFFSAGEIDEAIHWAEKALDVNPNAVEPRVILARSYNAQRKYEKALLTTNGVVADNLGNAALLEAVGDAQFSLGHTADAVGTYEALVDAAPYSGAAYFYLARSYMENKQDDRVRPTLEKALAIDPENYPARVAFARFVLTTGDIDQAAPLVDSLAKQFKDNPEVLELSGRLALARGDYAGAAAQLADARDGFVKVGIVRRSVTEDLVEALWRQGHRDRALAEMEEWLRRNPNDVPMRLQVAAVQAQFGNIDAAADQYARVIETQPSNWLARNDLAMLLYRQGDYETASKHAEIAYQLAGDNAAVLDTLGVILLAERQVDRALPLLERANQVAPYQPEIALHLSDAYEQSGRKVEARTVLERVLWKLGEFEGRDAVEERYRDLAD